MQISCLRDLEICQKHAELPIRREQEESWLELKLQMEESKDNRVPFFISYKYCVMVSPVA